MASTTQIIKTKDGSDTLYVPELDETYHSSHGAHQESVHVYIKNGLEFCVEHFQKPSLRVFEMGYGTGLNAQLTAQFAHEKKHKIRYTSIEKYPLSLEESKGLNYHTFFPSEVDQSHFEAVQNAAWNKVEQIHPFFEIEKIEADFFKYQRSEEPYDLIYYDAFGHRAQSELWEKEPFAICHGLLAPGGVLVTYASKGSARRNLIDVGFRVDKLPGPPGKREMMRAIKEV